MMNPDLGKLLPSLLPRAIAWAEIQAQQSLAAGTALNPREASLARAVGVVHPERIRIQVLDALPQPADPQLRSVTTQLGLLGPETIGLTLGYAVLLCRGHQASALLLSHEFRHVQQYEALGSIERFLGVYLQQMAEFGYYDAPLEEDARAHEREI